MIPALTRTLWSAVAVLAVAPPDCPPVAEPMGLPAPSLPDGNVDRIEAGLAVILTVDDRVVHRDACGLREGDVILGGRPDAGARDALERRVRRLRLRLEGDDGGGDVEL
jgi:hypothetical protein